MALSPQVSNWVPQQEVTAAEMLLCTNDLYQRLGLMSTIQPFILNGLEVSVNESGLVTVTAGAAISPNMTTPAVPAAGTQIIGVLQSQQSVQIPSNTSAFGVIVLRQTGTVMTTSPNIIISSALVYISTSNTAYPAIGPNDVPLVGVYVTGTSPSQGFELDMGQRAVSTETYYQAIQGVDYFQNGNFYQWPIGTSTPFSSVSPLNAAYTPVTRHWSAQGNSNSLFDVTYSRVSIEDSIRAQIPNFPEFGMQIERSAPDINPGVYDYLAQLTQPYYALNGKILTVSFWAFATASGTLNGVIRVAYNAQQGEETVIPQINNLIEIIADGAPRLYTFTYAIPDIQATLGTGQENYIAVKLGFGYTNQTYTVTICEAHNCGGAMYVAPPANITSYQGCDLGKIEMGNFDVENIGFGYIPFIEGTIGSAASGATIAANSMVGDYYIQLWNMTSGNPSSAPVTGGRGVSGHEDFLQNKPMGLLRNAGMVWGNAGAAITSQGITTTTQVFGVPVGEEAHTMTLAELVPHSHPLLGDTMTAGGGSQGYSPGNDAHSETETGNSTGAGAAFNVMQPTNFCTMRIKL